jgi:hypothetical protein
MRRNSDGIKRQHADTPIRTTRRHVSPRVLRAMSSSLLPSVWVLSGSLTCLCTISIGATVFFLKALRK